MEESLKALIDALVADHHRAFLASIVSPEGLNMDSDQLSALMSSGALSVAQLTGWPVPGMTHRVDSFLFLQLVAREMETEPERKRDLHLTQWVKIIDAQLENVEDPGDLLGPRDAAAHAAALRRAGDFAVGVGADVAEDIKVLTARAVAERWDERDLARELADRSGVWVHNWERIARTELQGAYNEGRVYSVLERYGAGARVARLPETDACKHCKRVFLAADGKPRIFTVEDLASNGTNVGRPAAQWQPTIWPVHPNCRCDVVSIPDGMYLTADGRLRRDDE